MTPNVLGRVSWDMALSQASVAVLITDLDGTVLDANERAGVLLATPRSRLAGRSWVTLAVSPAENESFLRALHEARTGAQGGEFRLVRAGPGDPGTQHVRVSWTLMRGHEGQPVGLAAVCLDETLQVVAERRAAHADARFEQSAVPQATLDMSGIVVDANQALCDLLARTRDHVVGSHLREMGRLTDDDGSDRSVSDLFSGKVDSIQVEGVLRVADGRPVHVLADATLLRDSAGGPLGVASYLHDLTSVRDVEQRRQQQEDFFLALSQRASDLAVVLDSIGQVMFVSPALEGVLGYAVEDVLGTESWEFIHPEDEPATRSVIVRVMQGTDDTSSLRIRDASGAWRWFEATFSNLLATAVGGVVCNLRDITERVGAERALRASEARYRAIADSADEGLCVATADGRTLYVNSRLSEILGLEPDELHGRSISEILTGVPGRVTTLTRGRRPGDGTERYETAYPHPDGALRTLRVAATHLEEADQPTVLAMVSDITESRRLELELSRAALHDGLTGLPNRALLLDRLEHALTREAGQGNTAVLFVDLDQFRIINDARGHAVGDELLIAVAERLRTSVRQRDTLARFGGDEFLIICEEVSEAQAMRIATAMLRRLDEPFIVAGGPQHIAATIGVALSPSPSADHLLRSADTAMKVAKDAGRHAIRLFDASMAEQAEELYELGADLREALAQDQLTMHFQPLVDLGTGTVVGVEALARWDHPRLGPVSPDRFVPLAEDIGLSPALDRWAVSRALRDTAGLKECGALGPDAYVAVNLSARNLADPELEKHIGACASAAGLSPAHVVLEITEGAIMAEAAPAIAQLRRLRGRGFQVALDDFGTGHSSLAHLRTLPISTLKIDRSFISEIARDRSSLAITASVVDLARTVGVTVVAEGVETEEQASLLRELDCGVGQGWLWSPAVSPGVAVDSGALVRTYDPSV